MDILSQQNLGTLTIWDQPTLLLKPVGLTWMHPVTHHSLNYSWPELLLPPASHTMVLYCFTHLGFFNPPASWPWLVWRSSSQISLLHWITQLRNSANLVSARTLLGLCTTLSIWITQISHALSSLHFSRCILFQTSPDKEVEIKKMHLITESMNAQRKS